VVAVRDAKGNEVAYADHFRFSPDPALCFDAPEDGVYLLEIRDALYRGREDFIYRVTVGEVPFVTDIFPLGGRPGTPVKVSVAGWNLAQPGLLLAPPANAEGIQPIPELNNGFAINSRLFAVDALPQITAAAPGGDGRHAQQIALPVVINGRIASPGDIDVFAFQCGAGQQIVAETYARRLYSQLDSWLKVTDAAGRQLAFNDDAADKGAGLLPFCADSYLTFTAPAKGTYYLHIGDSQQKGGPGYGYRLRISAPIHDFALRVTPSSVNGRTGANVPVTVYALRKDGYSGAIDFALKDAPKGFALAGGHIPAGQDQVRATLTFPRLPQDNIVSLNVEGRASIDGREVVHPALPADDMMQAFAYHHLVPAGQLLAVVTGTTASRPPVRVLDAQAMKLTPGGTGQTTLSFGGRPPFTTGEAQLQLSDAPDGIAVDNVTPTADGATISFKAGNKVKPGQSGNLIIEAFIERMIPAKDGAPAKKARWSIGYLPAIPYEVASQ
jgi:hypothetical protein